MKKQFLNLGKALSKTEQKQIFGGELMLEGGEACNGTIACESDLICPGSCTCEGPPDDQYCG